LAALVIAVAGEDRKAGISREAGICAGEFTKEKDGAAIGLDMVGMKARSAEARGGLYRPIRRA